MRLDNHQWLALAGQIVAGCGKRIDPASARSVGGGCIHTALAVDSDEGTLFLKLNRADAAETLAAESDGLKTLAASGAVRVPTPFAHGVCDGLAWLAMEWLALAPRADASAHRHLGEALAALHALPAERFGYHRDNAIGSTAQPNAWRDEWPAFVVDQRLRFQLDLARHNGHGDALAEPGAALLERLADWSAPHVRPALNHGDLWGGNWGVLDSGAPVVFDPAAFYGDPEADIAMTMLFGGFDEPFYEAYRATHPEPDDGEFRRGVYALYHVLNHLNLFGGGYLEQAVALMRALVRR
ncbi:MAG: fructosamine kinase family protein [Pseudomonadota bacterium]